MTKQEEIREDTARTFYENSDVSKTISWLDLPEETRRSFFYKADNLLYRFHSQGCVLKVDRELPLISRERAEFSVPERDCGGRKYTPIEWEDNVRYLLEGAEIQRDKDYFDSGYVAVEPLIEVKK